MRRTLQWRKRLRSWKLPEEGVNEGGEAQEGGAVEEEEEWIR